MSRKRTPHSELVPWAAELAAEDGTDPKEFHEKPWNQPRESSRKAQQLCGQVADALRSILPGLADEVLQNLLIVSVEPAPHTGRLLVTVAVPPPADVTDYTIVREHLQNATMRIRHEATAAIHRRKSPELVWYVI